MQRIKYGHWEKEGFVFMMADNYGHHSCEPVLYKTPSAYYSSGRVEPREEQRATQEDLRSLKESPEFMEEWRTHCESCADVAETYMNDMYL